MNRAARIGLIVLSILGFILLAAVIAMVITVRRPFPKVNGTLRVAGLQAEVVVRRDALGVPQIYAANEHDLYFAQGYTHAQDRFWQMEWWRHIATGRISEIAGESTVETDMFIRNLGWNRIATQTADYYRAQEPELWAILQAYSDGVNAYIEENRDKLSLNYTILGLVREPWDVEPWQPEHTIGWATVMAWDLRGYGSMTDEQEWAKMRAALGGEMVQKLYPPYPADRPIIAPSSALKNSAAPLDVPALSVNWPGFESQMIGQIPVDGFAFGRPNGDLGSNNWVVSGQHTTTGQPLLANDPHLGVQMPSIWYTVGLHAPGLNVVGFGFAGVPGIVIGHNDRIAWGVTNFGGDSQDLYLEEINPANPQQYMLNGQWQDMQTVEEVIKVNGGQPVTLTVRLTQHGPLLNNLDPEMEDAISVRWTAFEPSRLFKSLALLNRAQNYDEFHEALRYWDTAAQNVVYADVDGNIAYQATGRYPIREGWDGVAIVPGSGKYEWQGWIPYDQMPSLFNPPAGYIVTANNAVVDKEFPYILSVYWTDGDRAQRITQLLEAALENGGKVSADTMAAIQFDSYELLYDDYRPLFDGLSSSDAQVQAALERLRGWDGQTHRDSVPAALFQLFIKYLAQNTLSDELGAMADTYLNLSSEQRVLLHSLAADQANPWWDNTTTEPAESQTDIVLKSVNDSVAWLQDNVSQEMNDWTWGEIHTVTFASQPLGESGIGPIEALVNRGPVAVDGGSGIVNANGWSWDDPAHVTWHPSLRMIVDLSDFDASLGIHATGQSGHPFNSHYNDMTPLWADGDYGPLLFGQTAVEEAATRTLTLKPQ